MKPDATLYRATPKQRARVAKLIPGLGSENARHFKDLARMAGVSERHLRDSYALLDGDEFCIAKNADGLFAARDEAEAAEMTAELVSKWLSLGRRIRKRRRWAKRQSQITQMELALEGVA